MNIGKLNDIFPNIGFHVSFAGSKLIPQAASLGNPAMNDPLFIKWETIRDSQVELCFELPQPCFVDRLVARFGEKTALTSVALCCDGRQFSRHTAETGKTITGKEITLEAGEICSSLSLTVCADFSNLEMLGLDLYGATEDGIDLFPTPNTVTPGCAMLPLSQFRTCNADSEDGTRACKLLCEKFREKAGFSLQLHTEGDISFVTDSSLTTDGYELEITQSGTVIRAGNLRGFVMGAETFIKLVQLDGVPTVTVSDSPAMPFRGVHLFIPSADKMDFAKRLIKYLISPMGYNTVILQVSGGMIYDSHPNISAAFENAVAMHAQGKWPAFPHSGVAEGKPITKALLKEYIAYIRSFGIDVIPEVQSLGHVQYMTHAYPEIAEIPEEEEADRVDTRNEDQLPSKFYRHCYCPSNPRSYEILFDILDEIIEVFQPKEFVHMGHDEVREIGVCRKCRQRDPADLFAEDVCRIHDYLAAKGLKMMMWGDMIQPVTKYRTPAAIDKIPKDIVMLDFIWYFHLDKDIEDNLLAKDYSVIYGNLYSSHFPRYESRIRKEGILGGQISAWVATSEYELQKEGKLYDMLLTAQMLWAESYNKHYTLVYDKLICARMPELRENLKEIRYPSRQAGAQALLLGTNDVSFPPQLPAEYKTEFVLNARFHSLVFYHTALRNITRMPWSDLDVVGHYTIHYEDGTSEDIPVTYSGNIGYWNRRQNQPLPHKLYRHTGYVSTYYTDGETVHTADGEIATLYRLEHLTDPQKAIVSVTLHEDPAFDAKILLSRLEGVTSI